MLLLLVNDYYIMCILSFSPSLSHYRMASMLTVANHARKQHSLERKSAYHHYYCYMMALIILHVLLMLFVCIIHAGTISKYPVLVVYCNSYFLLLCHYYYLFFFLN